MLEFVWIGVILAVGFGQIKWCKNQHYKQVSLVMYVQGFVVGLITKKLSYVCNNSIIYFLDAMYLLKEVK